VLDKPAEAEAPTDRGPDRTRRAPRTSAGRAGSSVLLRARLAVDHRTGEDPSFDIARVPARPPAPRSAALAAMARAETGALVALYYRSSVRTATFTK
jgi:alpha-D-ribose 1-methylphosphonate 5-triphosphate synthase subunit PhnI